MKRLDYHPQQPDHGLPLVQLKEQRRELVIAFQRRIDPLTAAQLMEIAAIQHAISAFEDVIGDIDAEPELDPEVSDNFVPIAIRPGRTEGTRS